jgi:hypothetical protein
MTFPPERSPPRCGCWCCCISTPWDFRRFNWLSLARAFLFDARDVWFVVGIPIYFYSVLSDGTEAGNRTASVMIGFSWLAIRRLDGGSIG